MGADMEHFKQQLHGRIAGVEPTSIPNPIDRHGRIVKLGEELAQTQGISETITREAEVYIRLRRTGLLRPEIFGRRMGRYIHPDNDTYCGDTAQVVVGVALEILTSAEPVSKRAPEREADTIVFAFMQTIFGREADPRWENPDVFLTLAAYLANRLDTQYPQENTFLISGRLQNRLISNRVSVDASAILVQAVNGLMMNGAVTELQVVDWITPRIQKRELAQLTTTLDKPTHIEQPEQNTRTVPAWMRFVGRLLKDLRPSWFNNDRQIIDKRLAALR